jgi:hypothetical protein
MLFGIPNLDYSRAILDGIDLSGQNFDIAIRVDNPAMAIGRARHNQIAWPHRRNAVHLLVSLATIDGYQVARYFHHRFISAILSQCRRADQDPGNERYDCQTVHCISPNESRDQSGSPPSLST